MVAQEDGKIRPLRRAQNPLNKQKKTRKVCDQIFFVDQITKVRLCLHDGARVWPNKLGCYGANSGGAASSGSKL